MISKLAGYAEMSPVRHNETLETGKRQSPLFNAQSTLIIINITLARLNYDPIKNDT